MEKNSFKKETSWLTNTFGAEIIHYFSYKNRACKLIYLFNFRFLDIYYNIFKENGRKEVTPYAYCKDHHE